MAEFSELLCRVRAGDPTAVAELYEVYRGRVEVVARRELGAWLRSRYDTADIAQSVFGDMLRELPRFEDRGEPAFRRWLLAKVHNKLCSKARRQSLKGLGPREARLTTEAGLLVEGGGLSPDAVAAGRDDGQRLGRLLGTLDADDRAVIGLFVDEGLPWADVARRLGLPSPNAARMRYVRALETLRRRWTHG